MLQPTYPNLELLEYKARQALLSDTTFTEKLNEAKANNKFFCFYLDAHVFPQVWGSTALGFDRMPDGSPSIGGCAMTKAYTTVFHEASISDTYVVFFGDRMCYKITNPTKKFLDDLQNRRLKPFSEALNRY